MRGGGGGGWGRVGEVCGAEPCIQSTHIVDWPPTGAAQDSLRAVDTSGPQTDAVDQHSVRTHRVRVRGRRGIRRPSSDGPVLTKYIPVAT